MKSSKRPSSTSSSALAAAQASSLLARRERQKALYNPFPSTRFSPAPPATPPPQRLLGGRPSSAWDENARRPWKSPMSVFGGRAATAASSGSPRQAPLAGPHWMPLATPASRGTRGGAGVRYEPCPAGRTVYAPIVELMEVPERPIAGKRRAVPSRKDGGWAAQAAAPAKPSGPGFARDVLLWITLPSDMEPPELIQDLPDTALAFSFEGKKLNLCAQTDEVLGLLLDDENTEIEYSEAENQVNDSWEKLPAVGKALKDRIFYATECFCVAACLSKGVWAVGVGDRGRNRYQASRIALAAALCHQASETGEDVDLSAHSTFAAVMGTVGNDPEPVNVPAEAPPRKRRKAVEDDELLVEPVPIIQAPSRKRWRAAQDDEPLIEHTEITEADDPTSSKLPRDTPFWISISEDDAISGPLEGLPNLAIAVSTEGKRKGLYSSSDRLLNHILGDSAKDDVEYHDDHDWSKLPYVGDALKRVANAEECMCVATCPLQGVWAVGVGMKGANRTSAAKAAIATALALNAIDAGETLDLSEFQGFEAFVEEARNASIDN